MLPNPVGSDVGHEWVKLKNSGSEGVNLDGWQLSDKANHSVAISGIIVPGAELKIELSDVQWPLNNGGDEIELINASGPSVHIATHAGTEALPGQEIRSGRWALRAPWIDAE